MFYYFLVDGLMLFSAAAIAQTTVSLRTAETRLQFESGAHAPRLLTLGNDIFTWQNRAPETLIPSADIDGKTIPIEWRFNRALRALVASPRAVEAAALGARLAPGVLHAVIARAGDCSAA